MPPLCKGRWLGEAETEGLFIDLPSPLENNPSVSLTADSSPYTGEPKELPTFSDSALSPKVFPSSAPFGGTFPQGKALDRQKKAV